MNNISESNTDTLPLSIAKRWLYVVISFFLVAFGQPAWVPVFGLLAAIGGYALFWRVLLCFSIPSQRVWYAISWLFTIQLVQLSWFLSHPYLYIYAVYLFLSLLVAVPFGLIAFFVTPKTISRLWNIAALSSLWILFEWSRLFILSGFSFNPVGLALAGSLYTMQVASLAGVFGLSFWVMFTNWLALRARVLQWKFSSTLLWILAACLPYLYGAVRLTIHDRAMHAKETSKPFNALLVQTAFPVEESMDFQTKKNMVHFVGKEWKKILEITKPYYGKPIDLLVLPEFVVPFGTYANIYTFEDVRHIFYSVFGPDIQHALPSPKWPLGDTVQYSQGEAVMVSNAYFAQSLATIFNARVLAGLEDAEDFPTKERQYYSAALLFHPQTAGQEEESLTIERYEKRVLVPLGEYIPFTFCQELAKQYGVFGSFTPGKAAKVMQCGPLAISPSICYEETFGQIIQEGRALGADLFVNLTSDVWYPNSRLPLQHLEHARLRTVENGVPLIRACNTGITAAIDSLGRSVAVLGGESPEKVEWVPDALYVSVPTYHYVTLYSRFGDWIIVGLSLFIILMSVCWRYFPFKYKGY